MRERPILFNGDMVRAILAGTKTQTRRPVKLKVGRDNRFDMPRKRTVMNIRDPRAVEYCPFGAPGDRLWVRETWAVAECSVDYETGTEAYYFEWQKEFHGDPQKALGNDPRGGSCASLHYAADGDDMLPAEFTPTFDHKGKVIRKQEIPWRPSIHMPRWACRLVLEIVSVRVERLEDITIADAQAEGFCGHGAIIPFIQTWERVYGNRGLGCDAKPWVWVVEFKRVVPNA